MRKYNLNERYLDSIDNCEKAYWLGFLLADGSVRQNYLRLELSDKDYDQLVKFKNVFSSEHKIVSCPKKCSSIILSSKYLVNSVSQYGLIPNKTQSVKTPNIDKNLLSHFYRGVFDGDGWFTHRYSTSISTGKIKCPEVCFSSANKEFLLEIKNYLSNGKGYIIHRTKPNQSVYELHFGGKKSFLDVVDILYKDSTENTRLSRKYNSFLEYKDYLENLVDGRSLRLKYYLPKSNR